MLERSYRIELQPSHGEGESGKKQSRGTLEGVSVAYGEGESGKKQSSCW
jgi:hypothetical protein